ncbi:uncharacterized protein LOC120350581 [Nilaparvata lugens]|uniref:uncharacterized protein LOC120350581 n=1 Tax=Nilaparvata lugens TaxID=108931 RepID=UPI00193C9BA2|nr:uncharacterized protein LOC120350581 [Nilaparvata lugens]
MFHCEYLTNKTRALADRDSSCVTTEQEQIEARARRDPGELNSIHPTLASFTSHQYAPAIDPSHQCYTTQPSFHTAVPQRLVSDRRTAASRFRPRIHERSIFKDVSHNINQSSDFHKA